MAPNHSSNCQHGLIHPASKKHTKSLLWGDAVNGNTYQSHIASHSCIISHSSASIKTKSYPNPFPFCNKPNTADTDVKVELGISIFSDVDKEFTVLGKQDNASSHMALRMEINVYYLSGNTIWWSAEAEALVATAVVDGKG